MTTADHSVARRGNDDYARIERSIQYMLAEAPRQPSLGELARHAGLSEFHFQRLFTRWAGLTPKRFARFLTLEHAKALLRRSASLLDASYESGLSGPGRLHDLFVSVEAVTPGEFKLQGSGLSIRYGIQPSPFGDCLLAVTDRGICALHFVEGERGYSPEGALSEIRRQWPGAELVADEHAVRHYSRRIFTRDAMKGDAPLPVYLKGTNFQINVWKALLRIPQGSAVTYEQLASMAGTPRAVRAVGTAVGSNPIVFLVPCHRVIRKTGQFGNYGGGPARKRAILAWESAALEE